MVQLVGKYFIITSNTSPEAWYPNADLPHKVRKDPLPAQIAR